MFNIETFLDQNITGQMDTKVIPVPPGEYRAVVKEIKPRQWKSKDDPTLSGVALDIIWVLDAPEVAETLGRKELQVKQGIMLDIDDKGQIIVEKGKNIGLGRLREALNMNDPKKPFSFSSIPGQMAKVLVTHRIAGEDIFAEVKSVARAV